jgi:hypothetical protein
LLAPHSAHSKVLIARTATELREAVAQLAALGADAVILEDAAEYSAGELSTLHYAVEDAGMRWYAWVRTDEPHSAPAVRAGAFGLISLGGDFHETLPAEAASALTARAATGRPGYWGAAVRLCSPIMNGCDQTRLADLRRSRVGKPALPPVVAQDIQQSLSDLDKRPIDLETPNLRHSVLGSRIRSARNAGARFLVGSLAGEPGHITSRATWQEAEALVTEAGYTPTEALRAATLDAAFALGKDADIGSIAPGKYADIVAVRGDVLRNIEHLADVRLVFRHGVRFTPSAVMDEEE